MFLPYMGMVAILVWLTKPRKKKLCSLNPWRLYMQFGFNQPNGLKSEDNGQMDGALGQGRTSKFREFMSPFVKILQN